MMNWILISLGLFALGGFFALLAPGAARWNERLSAGAVLAGGIAGLIAALPAAFSAESYTIIRWSWIAPLGEFSLRMDALSAWFLIPIYILSGLAALYGYSYLEANELRRPLRAVWFHFCLLALGMAVVVLARNGLLFLIAWEVMAVASFFLVCFDDDSESVRRAGWIYLIATHLGTSFLLALFALLAREAGGSMDFADWQAISWRNPLLSSGAFLLAAAGFGAKAGFLPFHVWLPEAHPASPSHVSAVMSGVMIKTGIYGLIRSLSFLGPPAEWWGWGLIGIGAVSGISGILLALAQNDIKRLLAYSSVENIGIITMSLGLGVVGLAMGSIPLAALGFAGALLHVLNHSAFKGLLFFCAGAILHATHTRDLDQLGGLLKKMPRTSAMFLLAALAICALPPLNGFAGEFVIYLAAYRAGSGAGMLITPGAYIVIAALALIGGLAVACFTKAAGASLLGEPRSHHCEGARDPKPPMIIAMFALAGLCLGIAFLAPRCLLSMAPVIHSASNLKVQAAAYPLREAAEALQSILYALCGFLLLFALLAFARSWLLLGRKVATEGTWDCGYSLPTNKMQYTASSFSQPLTDLFQPLLQMRYRISPPAGLFPPSASCETEAPDAIQEHFYNRFFIFIASTLEKFRQIQEGRIHVYILYITLTLLFLLFWKLR